MGSDMLDELLVLALPLVLEAASVFLLGLIAIPLLRSRKTGRFEWHIGKRFKADYGLCCNGSGLCNVVFPNCYDRRC